MAKRLRRIGDWFLISRTSQRQPSPSELAKKFHVIESAAERLLITLSLPGNIDPDNIPPAILLPLERAADQHGQAIGGYSDLIPFEWDVEGETYVDYRGSEQLLTVITGVRQLGAWAKDAYKTARATVEKNKKDSKKRYSGDEAMQELIGNLVGLWIGGFKRSPGTSVTKPSSTDRGKASGPLVRFVKAYLEALKESNPAKAFKEDSDLENVLSPTEDAIRERIRDLGLGGHRTQ